MRDVANHTGIGCFAQGNTLRRVFRRALESFLLSKYEDICPPANRFLNNDNLTRFFRSVIHSGTGKPDQVETVLRSIPESAKIIGFFLGLNKQSLHLILFFLNSGRQQVRLTIRLERFTRLKKKRLH